MSPHDDTPDALALVGRTFLLCLACSVGVAFLIAGLAALVS